jgi:hypothetical protein
MHQKGYVVQCPGSRSIIISDDVLFEEHFSTAIAHTWQKYHDGVALRPLLSHIQNVDTTIKQTGTVATPVEEGRPIESNAPAVEPHNVPNLIPQDGDDNSTAESKDSNDDDDAFPLDEALPDDDYTTLLRPTEPEPELETSQILGPTLRRSNRSPKPNPKYASVAKIVAWENLCDDGELQEACAVEAHPAPMPTLTSAHSWEAN